MKITIKNSHKIWMMIKMRFQINGYNFINNKKNIRVISIALPCILYLKLFQCTCKSNETKSTKLLIC